MGLQTMESGISYPLFGRIFNVFWRLQYLEVLYWPIRYQIPLASIRNEAKKQQQKKETMTLAWSKPITYPKAQAGAKLKQSPGPLLVVLREFE